jgi:dolichyl-diphosphooligosaccharide--protein glycosyltransferase
MAMCTDEEVSWRIARLMDADFMLVVFGGAARYDADDIGKFLWMPQIANQTFTNISADIYAAPKEGGVIASRMARNMTQSMMFRFCYHNFKRFRGGGLGEAGTDLVRQVVVPELDIRLSNFQEAFTTKNWIVRIYRVLQDPTWDRVY